VTKNMTNGMHYNYVTMIITITIIIVVGIITPRPLGGGINR